MKIFGVTISTKNAAKDVKNFALNELDAAVQAAKQTEIGTAAANAISAVENKGLSGSQKLAQAVTILAPVVVSYANKGGFKAVVNDAEAFAAHMIESMLADVKKTKAVSIAQIILQLVKTL